MSPDRLPASLYATTLGDHGPRVVFLHGLFGQGKNWTSIAKGLRDSARVTTVDLPNHGRSPWTDHFSYPETADRVAEYLQEAGRGEPYAVVGHSLGGKVAMTLALRSPALVDRLCVVDVSPVPSPEVGAFGGYVQGLRSLDLRTLPDREAADFGLRADVPDPNVRSFLLQNLRREPGAGWCWQMNLTLLSDQLEQIGDWPDAGKPPYGGPVLWLAGAESGYVRPEYGPAMRALFPRVQLVTIKHAGHWVHVDQPEVFSAALRRFLHL